MLLLSKGAFLVDEDRLWVVLGRAAKLILVETRHHQRLKRREVRVVGAELETLLALPLLVHPSRASDV